MKELEYYISAFSIFLKNRHDKKDKDKCLELTTNIFGNLGYHTQIESYNDKLKTKNLIIGDIKNAKKVFLVAYDIPNRTLINKPYYVNNSEKAKSIDANNLFLTLALLLMVMVMAGILFYLAKLTGSYKFLLMIIVMLIMYLFYKFMFSSCKNNFAYDGSLSLIYAYCDKHQDDANSVFVLCDNSSLNYWGMRLFLKKHSFNKIYVIEKLGDGNPFVYHNKETGMLGKKATFIGKGNVDKENPYINNLRNGKSNILSGVELSKMIETLENVSENK